jgi:predicted ArsR family transcriptional regulator
MATKPVTMNDERDEQSGKFKRKYEPEQIIEVVRKQSGGATAAEVANELNAPRRSIHTRLAALHEDGRLNKRKVGPSVLWIKANDEETDQ